MQNDLTRNLCLLD